MNSSSKMVRPGVNGTTAPQKKLVIKPLKSESGLQDCLLEYAGSLGHDSETGCASSLNMTLSDLTINMRDDGIPDRSLRLLNVPCSTSSATLRL